MHAVELVSTGAELLNGSRVNTHARQLAEMLKPIGFTLCRDVTVPDDRGAIADTVREALDRVQIVFVTGGLGPTTDDVTRDAVADVLGRSVVLDEGYARILKRGFEKAGRSLTESAKRQALVVDGAETLPNSVGLAPGERLDLEHGKKIILLPGPPRELFAIVEQHVIPWLKETYACERSLNEAVLMLTGIGESDLATLFEEISFPPPGVEVGYCSRPGELEVRVSSATQDVKDVIDAIRAVAGHAIYAESRMGLMACVAGLMASSTHTFAIAESATGGELTRLLSTEPASWQKLLGALVLPDHEVLLRELAVSRDLLMEHGVASQAVVCRMAEAVRVRFGATVGVALGGPIRNPVLGDNRRHGSVWVALHDGKQAVAASTSLPGDTEFQRTRATHFALNQIRLFLLNRLRAGTRSEVDRTP